MAGYPDFKKVLRIRATRYAILKGNQQLIESAKAHYKDNPIDYIRHWGVTYDPRNAGSLVPTLMPFVLFKRQIEFVEFLHGCWTDVENGAVEKCRDVGATWVACAFSDWAWRFHEGTAIGWGSRKEQLVDKMGDPDSIFQKLRIIHDNTPIFFQPAGWDSQKHSTYMKIINPENGSTITGEAGDNIGRGGRKKIYFKDEAQPLTSRVLTPTGFKKMGDLKVGDDVIGKNGLPIKITQIKDFDKRDVYELTFTDNTKARCSQYHLWQVQKTYGNQKKEIINIIDLIGKYKYESPKGQIKYHYMIPFCDPIEFKSNAALPLDPYLLGCMLGDGSCGDENNTPWITSADEEIFQSFRELLPNGVVLGNYSGYSFAIVDENGRMGWKHKSRVRKLMIDSGISGMRPHTKFIPDIYKYSSIENRFFLLQGLMDTNGSSFDGAATFNTISNRLSDDFIFLVQSLGGVAYHKLKPNSKGYDAVNVINIALPNGKIPFRLKRKIETLNRRKQRLSRAIKNIKLVSAEPVRCISVKSDDGLYITDNFIVTHNSAHYERPEKIEAALGDNTNIQIDISSVNGPTTVFQRRVDTGEQWAPGKQIESGNTRVFIFNWNDHPLKTKSWYNKRRKKAAEEGLLHIFNQEVERDSTAAVEGILIPGAWVNAAIDAHLKLKISFTGEKIGAFDVADGGKDKQGLALRRSVIQQVSKVWESQDVGEATQKALFHTKRFGATSFQYDSVGVGAGAKSEINRLHREKLLPEWLETVAWCGSGAVLRPEARIIKGDRQSPKNKDFYANLKAQGWWQLRLRFEKTYKMINGVTEYPHDELISLDSKMDGLPELRKELSQPTYSINGTGKIIVDKTPDGMKSPNRADATMMCYWPKRKIRVLI